MKIEVQVDYVERRKEEYPSIEQQLDILYHEGYDTWRNVIMEIKERFPKGETQ